VRGRRLHRDAARGAAAAGCRSRHLGARRTRVRLRAPRQRRPPRLARSPPPLLRPLQRPRQRRAEKRPPRHAINRPGRLPRHPLGPPTARHATSTPRIRDDGGGGGGAPGAVPRTPSWSGSGAPPPRAPPPTPQPSLLEPDVHEARAEAVAVDVLEAFH